jgi:hypothetical protein
MLAGWLVSCGGGGTVGDSAAVGKTARPDAAAAGKSVSPLMVLLLGRAVNLRTMRAERTLTEIPPEVELSDMAADVAAARLDDGGEGHLEAFRLSTGALLWRKEPFEPCRDLWLAAGHLYAECGDKLLSYAPTNGAEKVVDGGPQVTKALVFRSMVAAYHRDGRVALFDAATEKRIIQRRLPELARAWGGGIVAPESLPAICAYGRYLNPSMRRGWGYGIGCYSLKLLPLWSKTVSFDFSPDAAAADVATVTSEMVRQEGPSHLVLNDQHEAFQKQINGVVVRWRDGQVFTFRDQTYATLEGTSGERLSSPDIAQLFNLARERDSPYEGFAGRSAKVVTDGKRAFVLIASDESTRLASVEMSTGHVLFSVPVTLGGADWKLEVVGGFPVVRTRFIQPPTHWHASVHDPATGRVVYEDERYVR